MPFDARTRPLTAPQARVRAIIQPKGKNAGTDQPGEPLTLRPAVKFAPAKP